MTKRYALVVSMLMSTVVLAGCALVTPTPPAASDTANATCVAPPDDAYRLPPDATLRFG